MKKSLLLILMAITLTGTGCSITGYKSSSKFRCAPALEGEESAYCASISTNYNDSITNGYTGAQSASRSSNTPMEAQQIRTLMQTDALDSGTPIRSQSEIARIWIAPYLDSEGDLVDQAYTYVTLNQGRWLIEHNQANIVEQYRPVRLLGGSSNNAASEDKAPSSGLVPDKVPDLGLKL